MWRQLAWHHHHSLITFLVLLLPEKERSALFSLFSLSKTFLLLHVLLCLPSLFKSHAAGNSLLNVLYTPPFFCNLFVLAPIFLSDLSVVHDS